MDNVDGRTAVLSDIVFAPIGGDGLVAQTVRRLMTAIETGLLELGEQLPSEAELSTALAISPVTLREALSILRQTGHIETRRGRFGGTFVCAPAHDLRPGPAAQRMDGITAGFIRELTDYRRAISCEAAALAARNCNEHDLSAIRSLVAAIDLSADWRTHLRLDADLHIGIAAASGSSRLLREQAAVEMETNGVVAAMAASGISCEPDGLNVDHVELLRALSAHDGALARDVMNRHVTNGGELLIDLIEAHARELMQNEGNGG